MLSFFRKHQRFFFIIVTVVIVISFSFFGTFGSLSQQQEAPDRAIGKGIDGSDIMQREVATLCRLIATSPLDRNSWQKGNIPNFLNDSVIEKDLIASGMAMMLARRYFEELKPEFEQRLARIKSFRPYSHPQFPAVSAEAVWSRFLPSLNQHLMFLKTKSDQFTVETLGILFQLYLDQTMLPPDFLKQILAHQLEQIGLSDPMLVHADLSLFGFHTLEDWFGPRFIELSGQLIINAARFAEDKGYHVSNEAVRSELYQNIVNGYREVSRQDKIQAQDVETYYQNQVRQFAADERSLLQSWRQVMLFRRLFQDIGNSVFLDPLPLQQFHQYTKNALKVDLYELPEHLQFRDLLDICRLQMYVESVSLDSAQRKNQFSLPRQFASVDQVEKRAPELVEQQIEVEYAEVRKDDLVREISLKETWDWEVEDRSWELLKKQFSQLASSQAESAAERHNVLDKLKADVRLKIDAFAQSCIIDQHPERILAALDKAQVRQASFGLRSAGKAGPFDQVKDQRRFAELLRAAPLRGQEASAAALKVQQSLNAFSEDQQTFYRIFVLSRNNERTVLRFAQARQDGTLERMLDKRLEESYPEARRKNSSQFQKADGSWKPVKEVREQVCRIVFADLFKAIEDSQRTLADPLLAKGGELPSSFYTQYRLYGFLSEVKKQIEASPDDRRWIQIEGEIDQSLEGQWKLNKTARTVERSSDFLFAKEQMFEVPVQGWSSIDVGHLGSLAFYRVLGEEAVNAVAVEEMEQGHHMLSLDAQRSFFTDLLKTIQDKKAIQLTASSGESM